jgi:hypothetical protein
MGYAEEQIDLVRRIVKGEVTKAEVQKELDKMEAKYGSECFNSYPVKKKAKPWDKKYLEELEMLSSSGASSKEFYLHMAEVSQEVNKSRFPISTIIVVGAVIVIGIVILLLKN